MKVIGLAGLGFGDLVDIWPVDVTQLQDSQGEVVLQVAQHGISFALAEPTKVLAESGVRT